MLSNQNINVKLKKILLLLSELNNLLCVCCLYGTKYVQLQLTVAAIATISHLLSVTA